MQAGHVGDPFERGLRDRARLRADEKELAQVRAELRALADPATVGVESWAGEVGASAAAATEGLRLAAARSNELDAARAALHGAEAQLASAVSAQRTQRIVAAVVGVIVLLVLLAVVLG